MTIYSRTGKTNEYVDDMAVARNALPGEFHHIPKGNRLNRVTMLDTIYIDEDEVYCLCIGRASGDVIVYSNMAVRTTEQKTKVYFLTPSGIGYVETGWTKTEYIR